MSRVTHVRASYGLFDTSAAEDSTFSIPAVQPFSDTAELLDEDQVIAKWLTLENNACPLDGSYQILPDQIASAFTGVWSDTLSGADGAFAVPPVLTVTFSKPHTSGGLTLIFSEATSDWCSDLHIQWLNQSGAQMAAADFQPNAGKYFCAKQVENFYKLVITFRKTNKPHHFLKLTGIRYGISMELQGDSLISCTVLEEVDPISSEISVNTLNLKFRTDKGTFDLLDLTGAYVLFQQRQKVDVAGEIDGVKMNMGSFYLDKPTTSDNIVTLDCIDLLGTMDDTDYLGGYWSNGIAAKALIADIMTSAGIDAELYVVTLDCIDLLGTMDDTDYLGGYWSNGIAAKALIADIMTSAGIDAELYVLDSSLENVTVKGYLEIQSHRSALQQVAFAIGAVVDCSRSEQIRIIPPVTNNPKAVPVSRKVVGHEQTQDALVTGVEVYTHNYALSDTAGELFKESRQPGEYLIQFSSPASGLSASGATITKSGVNYARIKVTSAGTVTISGKTYEDTQSLSGSVYMKNLPANAKPNIVSVTDCTLTADAQALAQRVYDYYQRRISDNGQIILADEKAGDWLRVQNADGKSLVGTAEQISIDLTGGFIAKVVTHGTGQITV